MKLLKGLQRTVLWAAALAVLTFGATTASWAAFNGPASGTCVGGAAADCVAAVGHASASVVTTLSINEFRAINFGNMKITSGAAGDATVKLDLDGTRTAVSATDTITLLYGADNGGFDGGPSTSADSGGQSPGHYTVSGANEGNAAGTQVYISFQDGAGNGIDMCTSAGVCDNYHAGKQITLTGPGGSLFVDKFVINEAGSDVYGHFVDNTNPGAAVAPGTTTPGNPGGAPFNAATAGATDVVVGATLHTDPGHLAGAYLPGRYTGTFDIMVSY